MGRPVFFLSTGRCGTVTLTKVLEHSPKLFVKHEPAPDNRPRWVDEARSKNLTYVETNNDFQWRELRLEDFPEDAKYVHLHRDPYQFIWSAMQRRWSCHYDRWVKEGYWEAKEGLHEPVQKVAWIWAKMNYDILCYLRYQDHKTQTFTDLITGNLTRILDYLDVEISRTDIIEELQKRHNAYRGTPQFNWSQRDYFLVRPIILRMVMRLNYPIR